MDAWGPRQAAFSCHDIAVLPATIHAPLTPSRSTRNSQVAAFCERETDATAQQSSDTRGSGQQMLAASQSLQVAVGSGR